MRTPYITIELVRQELQDITPGDNTIDCDLAFSDEEILSAMERAASRYNNLAPIGVDIVNANCLPSHMAVFMDAVLACLYASARHKLSRNLMTWQTGDTTVEFEKSRLQAYTSLQQEYDARWKEEAADRKRAINQAAAWGYYQYD